MDTTDRLSYDEIQEIPADSEIEFKEYGLDRNEKKFEKISIKGKLKAIILPNIPIGSTELKIYYQNITDSDFVALSVSPNIRLVIQVGEDKFHIPIFRVISINNYFISIQLQEVKLSQEEVQNQEFLLRSQPEQLLGFNSYGVGSKFNGGK